MFELNQKCELVTKTVAKGSQEESPVCVTVKLKFDAVPDGPVATVLGCKPGQLKGLFDKDGDFIFTGLDEIKTWTTIEDQGRIKLLGFEHDIAKLSAVTITPHKKNLYSMAMNVQIQEPKQGFEDAVSRHLHTTVNVKLTKDDRQLPLKEPLDQAA